MNFRVIGVGFVVRLEKLIKNFGLVIVTVLNVLGGRTTNKTSLIDN